MRKTTRKSEPTRPRLAQPPRKVDMCPGNLGMETVLEDQPLQRYTLPSTASGARQQVGPLARTTPVSDVGLTRMAKRLASLESPSILQRSPGIRTLVTQARWLI